MKDRTTARSATEVNKTTQMQAPSKPAKL